MSKKADYFLSKTLGEDFLESLAKTEIYKPGTRSVIDTSEIHQALQIVPRTVMSLLIKELSPMKLGENKRIPLFVSSNAFLNVTNHERDQFSGDIEDGGKKVIEFKFRSLPGVGLIILSTFGLYDMENLVNTPAAPVANDDSDKIQRMIDDRLALHDLVGKVVDKKIMEREAIHQLVLSKITEALKIVDDKKKEIEDPVMIKEEAPVVEVVEVKQKGSPVKDFLDGRKKKIKKSEYFVELVKNETVSCPDCRGNIFDGKVFSACVCYGQDMQKKVFVKKCEDGVKISFSRSWDIENINMLLETLRKSNG